MHALLAFFAVVFLGVAPDGVRSAVADASRALPPLPVVYVDPTGDDTTGDGSPTNPFRTLQRGHDVVDPGGTVRVRAGAYPFAVSISKSIVVLRDDTGTVTVGPPDVGTLIVAITVDDVSLRDLTLVGGADALGILATGNRLSVERCVFTNTTRGAIRFLAPTSSGHRIVDSSFRGVRAPLTAIAIEAQNSSGMVIQGCEFSTCDFGVRLTGCAAARLEACRFVDHFQSAVVAVGSVDLRLDRCRFARCGHFPTPVQAAAPAEALATVSLVGGCDRAQVTNTVVEDCGGYVGKNAFRAGANTMFDGRFAVAVLDCADVALADCSLHRNRFGGMWVGGTSTGSAIVRSNFVANGSANDPGKDVAIYSDGPTVSAVSCFFGVAAGPTFDGPGFGNGVLGGSITTTPVATAPHDAVAFDVVETRQVVAAERSVALVSADLTGDGWNEIVTVGDRVGTVEVHVNSATGFVARQITVSSGSQPVAVATGVLDADAHVDVAVLDELASRVVLLFGDSTGQLPRSSAVGVRPRPAALLVRQLDAVAGDDLVVACIGDVFGPGGVEVLRNDGTGQFTSTVLAGAVNPCALALVDLDDDTDLDIVAFDLVPAGPGLRLWLNDGNGGFGAAAATPMDAHPVTSASLVVLDQDGGPKDLAVATFQLLPLPGVCTVRLLHGDGVGGFGTPIELRRRPAPLSLHVAALGGGNRPYLLAVDRSAHTVLTMGPLAADATASFPYAQTFGETPLQIATGPVTNRTTDDVLVSEAARSQIVTQRGKRSALVEPYGTGCAGTSGVPRGQWASLPQIGSATFAVGFDAAQASTPAVLALGAVPLDLTLPGGCRLLVDMLVTVGTFADATGAGAVPLAIPNQLGLLGAALYGQWFIVDPGGGLFGTLAMTQGLRVVIGG